MPDIPTDDSNEILVQLLTSNQARLFSFIFALMSDPHHARDVLQETNLVIWRKAHEFPNVKNFWGWASRIAHFKVLSYYRGQQRDRLVFDENLLQDLAEVATRQIQEGEIRSKALRSCVRKLRKAEIELVQSRYSAGISVKLLAAQLGQSADAVGMRLYRIRQVLMQCVERYLARENRV